MTIKASGTLKFSDIEDEFGQGQSSFGRCMSNYYEPNEYGDMLLPMDEGIPTSGGIKFSDFYGKKLNIIVDAYTGNTPVYQINANSLSKTTVGTRVTKSVGTINSSKKVIIHVNRPIGSVTQEQATGQNQVAFKTGNWNGANVKLYVGGQGLIAGGGGKGGNGGINARGYADNYNGAGNKNMKGGDGTSALGIEDTSIEVTVMASNHPLRKSSGTPGAIVAGCAGGGGGAGADRWQWVTEPRQVWEGEYVQETVPNPDYDPDADPPGPETITQNSSTKLLVNKTRITLVRYWSGGGGGGGGAGLPAGTGGDKGSPTGTIPRDAGDWGSRGELAPASIRAKPGEAGKDGLNISNLNSGMDGEGGFFGMGGSGLARGGKGGDGGNYQSGSSSILGFVGGDSQFPTYAGEIPYPAGFNAISFDINPHPSIYKKQPDSRFQETGGPTGNAGYAVLCSSSWNNYGSNHDGSRVIGTFSQQQPIQG